MGLGNWLDENVNPFNEDSFIRRNSTRMLTGGFDPFGLSEGLIGSGDIVDFIQDPTGRKGTSDEMANIYRQQMAQQEGQWRDYLGGFDQFSRENLQGPGLTPYGEFEDRINAGEYLPPGSEQYADWEGPQYQREGGNFQDEPSYQSDPYQREGGQETYQNWTGDQLSQDPAYQFRLGQGIDAIEKRASQQGRSLSASTDKDIIDYAQGLASQEGDKAYGRHRDQYGLRRGEMESDRGFGLGEYTGLRGQDYGIFSGEQDRLRGGMESDRGFGLQEYATTTPMDYGMFTGERQFDYNADTARAGSQFQQEWSPYQFQQNIQAMRNPTGYMGQQGQGFQGLANAAQMGGGNAIWDWADLGMKAAPLFI